MLKEVEEIRKENYDLKFKLVEKDNVIMGLKLNNSIGEFITKNDYDLSNKNDYNDYGNDSIINQNLNQNSNQDSNRNHNSKTNEYVNENVYNIHHMNEYKRINNNLANNYENISNTNYAIKNNVNYDKNSDLNNYEVIGNENYNEHKINNDDINENTNKFDINSEINHYKKQNMNYNYNYGVSSNQIINEITEGPFETSQNNSKSKNAGENFSNDFYEGLTLLFEKKTEIEILDQIIVLKKHQVECSKQVDFINRISDLYIKLYDDHSFLQNDSSTKLKHLWRWLKSIISDYRDAKISSIGAMNNQNIVKNKENNNADSNYNVDNDVMINSKYGKISYNNTKSVLSYNDSRNIFKMNQDPSRNEAKSDINKYKDKGINYIAEEMTNNDKVSDYYNLKNQANNITSEINNNEHFRNNEQYNHHHLQENIQELNQNDDYNYNYEYDYNIEENNNDEFINKNNKEKENREQSLIKGKAYNLSSKSNSKNKEITSKKNNKQDLKPKNASNIKVIKETSKNKSNVIVSKGKSNKK